MDGEEGDAGGSRVGSEPASDAVSERDKDVAETETVEVEDEIQGEADDDEADDDEDEDEEDEEYAFRFKSGTNPLDFVGDDSSGVQLYQQFERLEYEALAEKKRKALADSQGERLAKKARQEDIPEAAMDEIMEAMNCGSRRKSRKPKKRGRRKGSKNKLSPEISRMLGDATLHYGHGRYKEAISVLNEVVRLAPNLPESYNMLGLVYKALGNHKIAFEFYMLAGLLKPKDSSLWKLLLSWSIEQENVSQTCYCLSKAITADPKDITLRFYQASLYADLGDYKKAAESYEQIQQLFPENVEAFTSGAKLCLKCGQVERAIDILEDYVKSHPCETDLSVVELLVAILMDTNAYERALKQIEHAQMAICSGKELPLKLKAKSGICYLHLGNMEKAEILYELLQVGRAHDHKDLITEVADSFMSLGYSSSALKFYHTLEIDDGLDKGNLHLRIAQCYLSLKERVKAKDFFYKALHRLEDNIEVRLSLATLLLEDAKEDEALPLLTPPENLDDVNLNSDKSKQWWVDPKIKFKLCLVYKAKGMTKEFVDTILPLVRESLLVENYWRRNKVKVKKRLTESVLNQRVKKVDCLQSDGVIRGSISSATPSDRLKASRAKKLLQKKAALKEEKKAAAKAAGLEWHSDNDNENDEPEEEPPKEAPLPNLLKDEEHRCLIKDLCKALASLQRYYEALEIIQLTLKLCQNTLPAEVEEFRSLGAQMAYSTMDPKLGFEYVKHIVSKHPYGVAAWNCYYNVVSRFLSHPKWGKIYSKFLRHMRGKCKDSVPATLIAGHQFTMGSLHQDAAREYLEAYKMLPGNPLINLCVGTALINLSLGFRLKNKHQTIAQGLAFFYNNLRLCENSQEALYNIARACHHVGLVTLAASYYEKVLQTPEKDHPIPKLPNESWDVSENQLQHGYCDLRREAAFNLHLIYRKSGAVDLARQVLKNHCTF